MQRIVCELDDELHRDFLVAIGDVPVAKAIRRWVRETVERAKMHQERKE